jgi:hypothetical protein
VIDPVEVEIGDRRRAGELEPSAFGDDRAVLGDQGVAAEDDVLRRLHRSARDVHIGRVEPARLLLDQLPAVVGLGHPVVARREVENHLGAGEGVIAARRRGSPQVFADLDRERHPSGPEQLPGGEPELAEPVVGDREVDPGAGGEPAALVNSP